MSHPNDDQLNTVLAEIHGVAENIGRAELDSLATSLLAAGRVFVTGEGRSGFMAEAFAMRLMHLGIPVFVVGETTTPAVNGTDTVVAVSGSGTTGGTVRVAEQAGGRSPTIQPLSSLFDQATHIALDVVCLIIAGARGVDNGRAAKAHANTE